MQLLRCLEFLAFGATQAMMAQTDEAAAAESDSAAAMVDSAAVDSAAIDTAAVETMDATEETVAPVEEESSIRN